MEEVKLTVSQVAQEIGESVHTVRNWLRDFRTYIPTEKTESNYNLFTQEGINSLNRIKKMYREQNLSTKQIEAILSGAEKPVVQNEIESISIIREILDEQKRFNEELVARIEEQNQRRDQQLMIVLSGLREQNRLKGKKKPWWKPWSKD